MAKTFVSIIDFIFRPFYRYLFFFPFNLKIGKYSIFKQFQYLHFRVTRKYRLEETKVEITLPNANPFFFDIIPGEDFHQMHLFMSGYYEKIPGDLLLEELHYADMFIDVGAYLGYYSIAAALKKPEMPIFAFEPQKEAFVKLLKHKEINQCLNLQIFNLALGNNKETKRIYIHTYPEQSSLLKNNKKAENFDEVTIEKLDNLFKFESKRIVIKIDTEGFEFEVVKGMKNILANNNCVLFLEYNPKLYKLHFGKDYTKDNLDIFPQTGYINKKISTHSIKANLKDFVFKNQERRQAYLLLKKANT